MISAAYLRRLLPVAAFFLFASIALVLWKNQNRHERELVLRHTEASAEQIRIRVEGLMKTRMASLELLADRWVERRPPDFSQERFLQFAHILYTHYPGFTGINWIDAKGFVRWVFPEKTNAIARGKAVDQHPDSRYRAAFNKAKQGLGYSVTPCIELYQGGIGFDTFWPLMYDGRLRGYLNGVFQVKLVMDICLAKDILERFCVRIYEEERLIYHNAPESGVKHEPNRLHALRKIDFFGKAWQLDLEPAPTVYSPSAISHVPFLVFGLALSASLSLLLHFLLHRMHLYREAMDHAVREVSERKGAEEALRQNEKKLEALLAELAAKNVALESFVYSVSHDLKTPIVTIEGFIGALREDFGNALPEKGEKYLTYMSDAARKMELLINDLLDLSRIGRLTEKKREIPFAGLVKDALKTLQPQIKERGIKVNVQEELPIICGERKRLGQVMDNLLANAIKYIGQDNPLPRIDVGVEKHDTQRVFFIRDNGIGIDKNYFDKIFHIFERLPSAKKIGEGTGIGLTIVKGIIEHHGGKVWLTSELEKGSTFFFTLGDKEV